jgi:hypothetical protein
LLIGKAKKVDIHHFPWFRFVMAGLKSFLYAVAPILDVSPAALYERQRALVNVGALKTTAGRGPGSGVPFTAENFSAILISLLAAESLSKVDTNVADLCEARPVGVFTTAAIKKWASRGKPTFASDVGRVLAGQIPLWNWPQKFDPGSLSGIRVTQPWRGQIVSSSGQLFDYYPSACDQYLASKSISRTAEIESEMLSKLITFTKGALSQIEGNKDNL